MSSDDFRDLVEEFDHEAVSDLTFYRWAPPDFAYGEIVPGTGGYAEIVMTGPRAYVPSPPNKFIMQLPEGDRERGPVLIWQVSEIAGAPVEVLQAIKQSAHSKPDRVFDADAGLWYQVATQYDYRAVAKVNGVVCVLIDGDPL